MKPSLFLIFLLIVPFFLKAQDTIVKRDGEKIASKITEVNPHDIRFKKLDNVDGPVYRMEKEQISYIVYSNGTRDSFETYVAPPVVESKVPDLTIQTAGRYYYYKELRIKEPDMHAVVRRLKDLKLNSMIRRVENLKFIQDVTLIASIPVFISGLYTYEKNQPFGGRRRRFQTSSSAQQQGQKNGITLMIAALALDAVSISFMFDRKRHNHLIVNTYNKVITLGNP